MLAFVLAGAIAAVTVEPAEALRYQERPGWMLGIGMGYGPGGFDNPNGRESDYRSGAIAHMYAGRMLGQHFMVGAAYEGWMVEIGGAITDSVAIKVRRNLQNFAANLTWFPGDPLGPTGGIFMRGSIGIGWAGTAVSPVFANEAQHNASRIDEWGTGISIAAGYEFWIARNFAAGLAASYDYFTLDERIVDSAGFGGIIATMGLHF